MKKAVRKAIIAGNWKMNKTRPEAKELLEAIKPLVANAEGKVEVIACVPFTNLETAINTTAGSNVKIGAENVHFEKSGAFTGEISADMLVELGVEYVVIGHSERRQYFGETDETVNKRTKAALAAGLKPIVCVGELLWSVSATLQRKLSQDRSSLISSAYQQRTLRSLLSLTSQFGLSAQVRQLQQIRQRKFAHSSEQHSLRSMTRLQLRQLQFSTAAQ